MTTAAPYYQDEHATVHAGDCLDILATLPDNSVHAVCTDPPYGLANTSPEQVADTIVRWVNGDRDYLPGGSGFMGKAWDAFVPPVAVWDECLRVLKPGGHVLAFAGSRTHDLMTLALRLAGFEIRDSIAWLYGSGFPKSLDVSKAIDKRPGVMRHAEFGAMLREAMTAKGYTNTFDVAEKVIGRRTGAVANWVKYQFPEAKWWPALRDLLDLDDDTWGPVIAEAERAKTGERRSGDPVAWYAETARGDGIVDITSPATPAAQQWAGWGTALKPAFEPIVVARKPLAGTVAGNVLTHGTGALNVDACRVATDEKIAAHHGTKGGVVGFTRGGSGGYTPGDAGKITHSAGRWPTNVLLDDTQAAELDKQSGDSTSTRRTGKRTGKRTGTYGEFAGQDDVEMGHDDTGGASRFFPTFRYEPKAPASERPKVNGVAHPTVKPVSLLRWLVRLVTPPGGTILDPFAGSGTTLEAALIEGFQCIGIERETDYLPLIRARLSKPLETVLDLGALT